MEELVGISKSELSQLAVRWLPWPPILFLLLRLLLFRLPLLLRILLLLVLRLRPCIDDMIKENHESKVPNRDCVQCKYRRE